MLTSILPPVGDGRSGPALRWLWIRLAAIHSIGTTASAVVVGGLLAFVVWGVDRLAIDPFHAVYWMTLVIVVAYLPRLLGWTLFPPLLQSTLQVPRRWMVDHTPGTAALLFGLGLGSGFCTRIIVPTYYLLFIWPFLAQDTMTAVVVWAVYGFSRSLHVWWLALTAPVDDHGSYAFKLVVALTGKTNWLQRAHAILLVAAAAWVVAEGYTR